MGKACKTLSVIYGILGTISAFVVAFYYGRVAEVSRYETTYTRNWVLTISLFLGIMLSVIIVCVALSTLGDVWLKVNGLSYYRATQESDTHILQNGGWKCPDCGTVNMSYNSTCKCGRSKV